MSSKKISKNSKIAWKNQINIITYKTNDKMNRENLIKEKKKKGLDKDSHNRAYITTKIREYINNGLKKEEAIQKVMEEEKEIIKQFEYLEKLGLKLEVIFSNWVNGRARETVNRPFSNEDDGR